MRHQDILESLYERIVAPPEMNSDTVKSTRMWLPPFTSDMAWPKGYTPMYAVYVATHSSDSTAACSSTVRVASSCLSGG